MRQFRGLGSAHRIFEAVKSVVAATGALASKTRRALDSTVLDDPVATQGTVIQLIAARMVSRRIWPWSPMPASSRLRTDQANRADNHGAAVGLRPREVRIRR